MAELVLELKVDPESGERVLVVHYESDEDALAMEHERDHRRLFEAIVPEGARASLGIRRAEAVLPVASALSLGEARTADNQQEQERALRPGLWLGDGEG